MTDQTTGDDPAAARPHHNADAPAAQPTAQLNGGHAIRPDGAAVTADAEAVVPSSAPEPPAPVVPPAAVVPPAPAVPPMPDPAVAPGAQVPTVPAGAYLAAPAGTPAPGAYPAAAASTPNPFLAAFTKGHLLGALAHSGIALGAAVAGGLILALVLLGLSGQQHLPGGLPAASDIRIDIGMFFAAIFTLAGMVLGGELNISFSAGTGMLSGGGGGSLWLFPLTITIAALGAVLWWGVREERRHPLTTLWQRVAYGVGVGLVASIVLVIVALVFSIRIQEEGAQVTVTGASYRVVLFGTLLFGLAAFLGRTIGRHEGRNWLGRGRTAVLRGPRVLRESLVYTLLGLGVFGLVGVIFGAVNLWQQFGFGAIPLALVGFVNVAAISAVLGHLGGISAGGGLGGFGGSAELTVIGLGEPLAWVLVAIALLLAVFVALWIGTRRPRSTGIGWARSWQLPVVAFAGWTIFGLLFFGVSAAGGGSAAGFGGSGAVGVGLSLWTPLVLAAWAFAVELGAETLPRLVYGLSPNLHAGLAGRAAVASWAAGPPATTAVPVVGAAAYDSSGAPVAPGAYASAPGAVPPAGAAAAGQAGVIAPGAPGAVPPGAVPAGAVPPGAVPAGAVAPGAVPAGAPGSVAPPAPLSPGAKRGLLIGLISVGALVVLAVGAAVTVSMINGSRGPEATVRTYLDHIAAGDAEAANALVDPNVASDARGFLTDEVLGAAEPISDVSVRRMDPGASGDTAYLEVSYKLDGVTQTAQLTAQKGAPEWLVLDTWEITESLAQTVSVYASGQGVAQIGGTEIPFSEDEPSYRSTEIVLYPGIYPVTSGESTFFTLEETELVVGSELFQEPVELTFTATDALTEAVQEKVNAFIDSCVAQTVAEPEGCPFDVWTFADDVVVTWTVVEYPQVKIASDGARFEANDGTVQAAYTDTSFGLNEAEVEEHRADVWGDLTVDGDEVSIEIDTSWW